MVFVANKFQVLKSITINLYADIHLLMSYAICLLSYQIIVLSHPLIEVISIAKTVRNIFVVYFFCMLSMSYFAERNFNGSYLLNE